MYFSSIRLIGNVFDKKLLMNLIKIIISSGLMALGSKLVYEVLTKSLSINLSLLLSIIVAGGIYLILLIVLKVDEVKEILKIILKK
jgi:hypothetical protein